MSVYLHSDDLLKKCLHGQTQNPNESFNNIIWTKYPKAIHVSRAVLEMSVNSAVLEFNEGSHGVNGVYSHFGFPGGIYTRTISKKRDTSRVTKSHRKSSVTGKNKDSQSQEKRFSCHGERSRSKESYVTGG